MWLGQNHNDNIKQNVNEQSNGTKKIQEKIFQVAWKELEKCFPKLVEKLIRNQDQWLEIDS